MNEPHKDASTPWRSSETVHEADDLVAKTELMKIEPP